MGQPLWILYDWLVWSPCCPKDSQESSPTSQFESISSSALSLLYGPTLTSTHDWKNQSFDYMDLCHKVMSLLYNTLCRLVIAFLRSSKCLLISWLQLPYAVILEPKKIKSVTICNFPPIYLPWSDGTRCHDLSLLNIELKLTFSLSTFTFIKRLFSSSSLSTVRVVLSLTHF